MATWSAHKKLHGFSKSERLCNFSLKNLLFEKGKTFYEYPFKVYWKVVDKNLESIFFAKSVTTFQPKQTLHPAGKYRQNPSYPHKKIPHNAYFTHSAQCLIGVPRRVQKNASNRNAIKRFIREAYRQNKGPFYAFLENNDLHCLLAFIYTAKRKLPYREVESKIVVSLQKIQERISETQNL